MVRAPADWRRILRRAESLVRKRDRRALDLLLPALRWRDLKARNRAVVLLGRLGPIAFQALLPVLADARTAAERACALSGMRSGMCARRLRRHSDRLATDGPSFRSRRRPGILESPSRGRQLRHSGRGERDTRRKS